MSCTECGETSKYKCPTCRQPYCSVLCCKKHKEKPCSAPVTIPQDNIQKDVEQKYEYPTEDTVPQERLKLLDESTEVKKCLDNPHLRTILDLLDKSTHPEELLQEYMTEPIFTEFVDACLKVVQPQDDNSKR